MAFMRIDFGNSESEEREREELEDIFEGGAVGDLGEEGVLLASFGVGWGFKSSKCAFDCLDVRILRESDIQKVLTLKHILPLSIQNTCSELQILALQELCDCESLWLRGAWSDGLRSALLRLSLWLGLTSLLSSLLLGLGLLHRRLLLLQFRNEFWDGHSVLLRIDGQLSLHRSDLLWSWLLSWPDIERVARGPLGRSLRCHC
jgi:hypothetical protein